MKTLLLFFALTAALAVQIAAIADSLRRHYGFRAGIAVRVVTPDPLLPVSGGVGPGHAATKKQGDLTVRGSS